MASMFSLHLERLLSLTWKNRHATGQLPSLMLHFLHLNIQTVYYYNNQKLSSNLVETSATYCTLLTSPVKRNWAAGLNKFLSCTGSNCEGVVCTELECPSLQYIPLGQCCPICAGEQTNLFTLQTHHDHDNAFWSIQRQSRYLRSGTGAELHGKWNLGWL